MNTEYDVVIQVRAELIRVMLNGKKLFEHHVVPGTLTINEDWALGDENAIALWCNKSTATFKSVELTVLGDLEEAKSKPTTRKGEAAAVGDTAEQASADQRGTFGGRSEGTD